MGCREQYLRRPGYEIRRGVLVCAQATRNPNDKPWCDDFKPKCDCNRLTYCLPKLKGNSGVAAEGISLTVVVTLELPHFDGRVGA
jgi:hypothetical protein